MESCTPRECGHYATLQRSEGWGEPADPHLQLKPNQKDSRRGNDCTSRQILSSVPAPALHPTLTYTLTHSPSQPSTLPLTHTFSHILILRYTHIHTTNVKSLERSIKYVELLEPKIYLKKISIARICIDGTVMNLKAE